MMQGFVCGNTPVLSLLGVCNAGFEYVMDVLLCCYADVAAYVAQSLSVMQQQAGDEQAFEYNSLLRHGIFEAYSGILNGMTTPKCDQYLRPFAPVCSLSLGYTLPDLSVLSQNERMPVLSAHMSCMHQPPNVPAWLLACSEAPFLHPRQSYSLSCLAFTS